MKRRAWFDGTVGGTKRHVAVCRRYIRRAVPASAWPSILFQSRDYELSHFVSVALTRDGARLGTWDEPERAARIWLVYFGRPDVRPDDHAGVKCVKIEQLREFVEKVRAAAAESTPAPPADP